MAGREAYIMVSDQCILNDTGARCEQRDPNSVSTTFFAISNDGQVVGFYSGSESLAGDISGKLVHPFVLAPDGKTFTDFDVPRGVGKTFAQTIDDTGQVIGHYVDASGNNHGFIATPVR